MRRDEPTLFSQSSSDAPLAQRQRPKTVGEIVGQAHIINDRFQRILTSDRWSGFVFWGPPGTGKTSLAWAIAGRTGRPFHTISAVNSGVKEIRDYLERSFCDFKGGRPGHILFIDEFHRLNKAQQDVLLPFLEQGSIRFIGATTENPSFEVNNAVASRCLIYHFEPLSVEELERIVRRATSPNISIDAEIPIRIARAANGDGRRALNILENLSLSCGNNRITLEDFEKLSHSQSLYYDKHADGHYEAISAFIKSIRGGDPDAAVYYLASMLEAGEDPLFIARRLLILASEDIGNAEPQALVLASATFQAVHATGMPEARIMLSQLSTFLACAPKSNRSYAAINEAIDVVRKTGNLKPPLHILNAPTTLMKEWGYAKGYDYPHDHDCGWVDVQYLPEAIRDKVFYKPTERGAEKIFREILKERGKILNK